MKPTLLKKITPHALAGVDRRAQQRADDHIGAARLVDDRAPPRVVLVAEAIAALRHVAAAEIGAAADDDARRLARRVRVDDARRHARIGIHVSENAGTEATDRMEVAVAGAPLVSRSPRPRS